MKTMLEDIRRTLVRELNSFAAELELFPDDETMWKTLPGISNSAGNLALHVCGNLKHYIGGVLGNTGYVRDRAAEFNTRSGSRNDLVRNIQEAVEVVSAILPVLTEDTVADSYPEVVAGVSLPCGRFLIHLCAHAGFHLGQVGYLRRALTEEIKSSGGVSLPALAEL
jgi:uncharacterized damage-inducible protein DinB